MQFSRFLLISSFAFLISLHFANSEHHGHQGHGHGHGHHGGGHGHSTLPAGHRIQREHSQHHAGAGGGGPPSHHFQGHPQSGGSCGCSSSNARHPFIAPQNGIPIFLFPDHAQKAVDVILGAEGAFYWDNDELAHRVFDLLAHKFPQKWFLVGVGNSPGAGLGFRLLKGQREDLLQGVVKVSPGHSPFAFFDRRQFPRENETQLWYFVRAVEPTEAEEGAEGGNSQQKREKAAKKMAECVRRETKSCIPASLASTCSLDFLALIDQNTHPAIYASEALSANQMQLKVLQTITQCTADNEGTRFYAVMAKGPTNGDGESGEGEE